MNLLKMNCKNQKCGKEIIKSYNCNKCDSIFCSNSCMIDHIFQAHQSFNIEAQRKSLSIRRHNSPFISQGEFLKEVENDPLNDYSNMEFITDEKTMKKKILGTGAFGYVYLARNIKTDALFAIKHVIKTSL